MSGLETVLSLQDFIPPSALSTILISATSLGQIERAKALLPSVPVLHKPFKMRTLLELIDNLQTSRYIIPSWSEERAVQRV
jgi:hypothetical protein